MKIQIWHLQMRENMLHLSFWVWGTSLRMTVSSSSHLLTHVILFFVLTDSHYLPISKWTSIWLPFLGYCDESGNEHGKESLQNKKQNPVFCGKKALSILEGGYSSLRRGRTPGSSAA